jgi:hypothetical protein
VVRMKIAIPIIVLALVALWLGVKLRAQTASAGKKTETGQESPANPKNLYSALRSQILQGSRSRFGIAPTSKPTEPWGVLMDINHGRMTLTVVAASDGSASLYFNNGGGYMGGNAEEPIRRAAQKAVEVAGETQPLTHPTTTFPLPRPGEVIFYLLTDSGVYTVNASQDDLNSTSHPLRRLGEAMQNVIRQYGPFVKATAGAAKEKQSN